MAKVKIKFSKRAYRDLEQLEEYYEDKPSSKQIKQVFDSIDSLREQPLRGRPIPELNNDKNVRQVKAGGYRVMYHVITDYLLRILRVFSYKRHFDPDEHLDFED